ncbi:MAG: hypothetical protein AVDCRST_MAG32-208, partial [uncultured Nocardioides sp.]
EDRKEDRHALRTHRDRADRPSPHQRAHPPSAGPHPPPL